MGHLTMMLTLTLYALIYSTYLFIEVLRALPRNQAEITDEQGNPQETAGFLIVTNDFKNDLTVSVLLLVASIVWIFIYLLTKLGG